MTAHWYENEEGEVIFDVTNIQSVIVGHDGSILAAGYGNSMGQTVRDGFVMKLEPEQLGAQLIAYSPEDTTLTVLRGDTIDFWVSARDDQGDELSYLWIMGADTLSIDSTTTVVFDELGDYDVQCQVSDGEFTVAITRHVQVVDLYISDFTPDSLEFTVRRTAEVPFRITVRAVEGERINYRWRLTDLVTPQDTLLAEADSAVVVFPLARNYRVESEAYRGELSVSVSWLVHVRSIIWWWLPQESELTVPLGAAIHFSVEPFNPESNSLSFSWVMDGVDVSDSAEVDVTFSELGRHEVTAYVVDGVEADTLRWEARVYDQAGIQPPLNPPLQAGGANLFVSPNPFNDEAIIKVRLSESQFVEIAVYDIAGRLKEQIIKSSLAVGEHQWLWNAGHLPTGIYLVKLSVQSGSTVQKIALLK
ncbi:MAG: T9SS type A sorting domain-containing protein [Calditrichota bacterium]